MNFTAVQIQKVMPYEKNFRINQYRGSTGLRSRFQSCLPEASAAGNLTWLKQERTSQLHLETLLQSAFFVDNVLFVRN